MKARLLLGLLAMGCASEPGSSSETEREAADVTCQHDRRVEDFYAGVVMRGHRGALFVLRAAKPTWPNVGTNSWKLMVSDMERMPFTNATVQARASMPDHGHDASWLTAVELSPQGEVDLAPLELFMPGVWQVDLRLESQGGELDDASLVFCVDG